MAEMVAQLFIDIEADLDARPWGPADGVDAARPLPPPMVNKNYESTGDKCFIGGKKPRGGVIGGGCSVGM